MSNDANLKLTDREVAAAFRDVCWADRFPPVLSISRSSKRLKCCRFPCKRFTSGVPEGTWRRVLAALANTCDSFVIVLFGKPLTKATRGLRIAEQTSRSQEWVPLHATRVIVDQVEHDVQRGADYDMVFSDRQRRGLQRTDRQVIGRVNWQWLAWPPEPPRTRTTISRRRSRYRFTESPTPAASAVFARRRSRREPGDRVRQHHELAVAGDAEREDVAVAALALVEPPERIAGEVEQLPPARSAPAAGRTISGEIVLDIVLTPLTTPGGFKFLPRPPTSFPDSQWLR